MSLPSSIDDFKSVISRRNGIARTNRFVIFMNPPIALKSNISEDERDINYYKKPKKSEIRNNSYDIAMLCESCTFPGKTIATLDYKILRQSIKIPNGYSNDDIVFVFHLTGDYYMKGVFDRWIDMIINVPRYRANYVTDYITDVTIQQLNNLNKPIYSIKLIAAYPISMTAISLDNTADGQTQRVTVTLTYQDYIVEDLEPPQHDNDQLALNTRTQPGGRQPNFDAASIA